MLEKLNSFSYNEECQFLLKQLVSQQGARAEFNLLKGLGALTADSSFQGFPIRVPKLYPEHCTNYTVAMSNLVSIRLLDIIALLNKLILDSPQGALAEKCIMFKRKLVIHSLQSIAAFQGERIQDRLKDHLGTQIVVYDYFQKFKEAIEYLASLYKVELTTSLWKEVEYLCGVLSNRASVLFRDASLKNRIVVVLPGNSETETEYPDSNPGLISGCARPSEWPWTDISSILEMIEASEDWGRLEQRIYDIDFESSYALTVPQDDYLHILCSEAVGFDYGEMLQNLDDYQVKDETLCNYILLFRFFREWVRRLFYRHERPALFGMRYRYETIEHHFNIAFDALLRLRRDSPQYLGEVYALMRLCSPTQSPPRPTDMPMK
jgi:hypothetical protein